MGRLGRMFIPRPARVVKRAVTHPVSTAVRAATPRPVRQVQRAAWKVANPIDAAQNAAWKAVTPKPKKHQRKPAAKRVRQWRFNPPPGWPTPPAGWTPPPGWQPDPSWPPVPPGWKLWIA
jgi:hypothetical protein